MRLAITGGTGFVGGHLGAALSAAGHDVVVLARGRDHRPWAAEVATLPNVEIFRGHVGDPDALDQAFRGCEAVAHCAGINRETGSQTYEAVHVRGTEAVVRAAEAAGVRRLALLSFLRARPETGSPYHESKWAAEEIVRASSLDWTILKAGMMFGRGDGMLDHLSRAVSTFPFFAGIGPRRVRPLSVEDAVRILLAALVDGRLPHATVGLVGPTELSFDDAARLVARVLGARPLFVRVPLVFHRVLARVAEATMTVPLISAAQVRILEEGIVDAAGSVDPLPPDLLPSVAFDEEAIRRGLPEDDRRFHIRDLRLFSAKALARSA